MRLPSNTASHCSSSTPRLDPVLIHALLAEAIERRASDVHVKSGVPVAFRIDGELVRLDSAIPDESSVQQIVDALLTPRQRAAFEDSHGIDFAFTLMHPEKSGERFRANVYKQRGALSISFRHVRRDIPSLQDLHLPPLVEELAFRPRGLILVTGAVGSAQDNGIGSPIVSIPRCPIQRIFHQRNGEVGATAVGADDGGGEVVEGLVDELRVARRFGIGAMLIQEVRELRRVTQ